MQGDLLSAGVLGALPNQATDPRPGAEGGGLWTRLPLSDVQRRQDFSYAFVSADVAVAPIRFSSAHMAGPTPRAARWAKDIGHLPAVLDAMPADRPVLLAGDLNATPDRAERGTVRRGSLTARLVHRGRNVGQVPMTLGMSAQSARQRRQCELELRGKGSRVGVRDVRAIGVHDHSADDGVAGAIDAEPVIEVQQLDLVVR